MAVIARSRVLKSGKKKKWFEANVYHAGRIVKRKSFDTISAAHAWHDKRKREYERGVGYHYDSYRFSDLFEAYLDEYMSRRRKSSRQAREVRFRYLRDWPGFETLMSEFSASVVDDWIAWLIKQPTAKSPKRHSFEYELQLLTAILNWYRERKNPEYVVPVLKRHRRDVFYKPIKKRRRDYFIRPETIPAWLNALTDNSRDPVYFRLALFMIVHGYRIGEAAGLCWRGVELFTKTPTVRILQTMSWDHKTRMPYIQQEAKNEESLRFVKIADTLIPMFKTIYEEQVKKYAEVRPDDLVFRTVNGLMLRDTRVRDRFGAAFKKVGLEWSGTRITRHTHATLGLVATHDLANVQASMGHSSQEQTLEYAKIVALWKNQVSDSIASLIGSDKADIISLPERKAN